MMARPMIRSMRAIVLATTISLLGSTIAVAESDAARLATGQVLFTRDAKPPCALCHTLAHADAVGSVGPILDELKPDAARVAKAVKNGIGGMPSYSTSLSSEQIESLAFYVSRVSGQTAAQTR